MSTVYGITVFAVLGYMCCWFIASLVRGRNDIADVAWGLGFIVAAAVSLLAGNTFSARALLISLLVLIWGVRLALHIHSRNRGKGEDQRYKKWREEWGRWFVLRSFFQVFVLQGVLLVLVAAPVIFINAAPPHPLTWYDAIGIVIWCVGFLFEAIGDLQLRRFLSDPAHRGQLMTRGLWKFSRHPNYFGEVTLWWGLWLLALPVPGGWLTVVGPVTITFLILKVSGIPMLEKPYEERPDFQEYKRRTSAFFPLPPRRME